MANISPSKPLSLLPPLGSDRKEREGEILRGIRTGSRKEEKGTGFHIMGNAGKRSQLVYIFGGSGKLFPPHLRRRHRSLEKKDISGEIPQKWRRRESRYSRLWNQKWRSRKGILLLFLFLWSLPLSPLGARKCQPQKKSEAGILFLRHDFFLFLWEMDFCSVWGPKNNNNNECCVDLLTENGFSFLLSNGWKVLLSPC